jgi:hypothetical protein
MALVIYSRSSVTYKLENRQEGALAREGGSITEVRRLSECGQSMRRCNIQFCHQCPFLPAILYDAD